ncbi:MAG TPA: glycosyltransferase family 4 protein [Candidatus Acidoferrales bacterium]|nr:glycosyltransferase family 4 protein [Candidatus Acidoferrales bacterium]
MDVGLGSARASMSQTPISILMFCNTTVRAGVEEHILELLRGLDRRQFRLHLACPKVLLEQYGNDIPKDVHVSPILLDHLSDIRGEIRLARTLRHQKIDILHCHMFRASLFASPIGRLCRVPVIIETTHVRETWRKGWLKSKFIVDRAVGNLIDHYIAVSEANARYLIEQKRIPARKVSVIQNGCSMERVDPSRARPEGIRESIGFSKNDLVLLVMARLEPQKGHKVLLQALSLLRGEIPKIRLICLGTGALKEELTKIARELNLESIVRFVGFQSNVADWLAAADIGVLPSFYEGLPLTAVETLAAGVPLVATAVDGTPEVVIDGRTGLLVPPGNPHATAAAIGRLIRDPELRSRLALAGRDWVLKRFTIQRQIEETSSMYLSEWQRHISSNAELSRERTVRTEQI